MKRVVVAALAGLTAIVMVVACSSFATRSPPPDESKDVEAGAVDSSPSDATAVIDATPDATVGLDATADAAPSCDGGLECERVVFVTSTFFAGNFLELVAADAKCNEAAVQTNAHSRVKGRLFKAWLGTPNELPAQRMVPSTARYINPAGQTIALSYATLTSTDLVMGIKMLHTGDMAVGNLDVWTGLSSLGTSQEPSCMSWTKTAGEVGTTGLAGATDAKWSNNLATVSCATGARLYCFEQ